MDKNGNIYETDSSQAGEVGVGRIPTMQEDGDVQALSVQAPDQVLRDRAKLQVQKMNRTRQGLKSWADGVRKRMQMGQLEHQRKEREFLRQYQQQKINNLRKSQNMLQGLNQNYKDFENMSGVSGYGYTADGQKPYPDHPSSDWNLVNTTTQAFGNMGMGQQSFIEKPAPDLTDDEEKMIFEWLAGKWVSVPGADPNTFSITDGIYRSKFMQAWWKKAMADKRSTALVGYGTPPMIPEYEGYQYGYAQVYLAESPSRLKTKFYEVPYKAFIPITLRGQNFGLQNTLRIEIYGNTAMAPDSPYIRLLEAFEKVSKLERQNLREQAIQKQYGGEVSPYRSLFDRIQERQLALIAQQEKLAAEQARLAGMSWWQKFVSALFQSSVGFEHPMIRYQMLHSPKIAAVNAAQVVNTQAAQTQTQETKDAMASMQGLG
jgi:hypothetical protein